MVEHQPYKLNVARSSRGDREVTMFADVFKIFDNSVNNGFPLWMGPDPGYKVDVQGQDVPDGQVTFFADIFSAFQATAAGGCATWQGVTCCNQDIDCSDQCENCVAELCVP